MFPVRHARLLESCRFAGLPFNLHPDRATHRIRQTRHGLYRQVGATPEQPGDVAARGAHTLRQLDIADALGQHARVDIDHKGHGHALGRVFGGGGQSSLQGGKGFVAHWAVKCLA